MFFPLYSLQEPYKLSIWFNQSFFVQLDEIFVKVKEQEFRFDKIMIFSSFFLISIYISILRTLKMIPNGFYLYVNLKFFPWRLLAISIGQKVIGHINRELSQVNQTSLEKKSSRIDEWNFESFITPLTLLGIPLEKKLSFNLTLIGGSLKL